MLHKFKIFYNRNHSPDETSVSLKPKEEYTLEKGIWKQFYNASLAVHVHSHEVVVASHAVLVMLLSQLLFTYHTVYVSLSESERATQSVLLQPLYAELESKKMIFFKHQLHVSDIVGQGEVYKTNFVLCFFLSLVYVHMIYQGLCSSLCRCNLLIHKSACSNCLNV